MSPAPETSKLSAETVLSEVQMAAGDLQTISDILISIGHDPNIEILHGWMSFFGRSVGEVADRILNVTGRLV